MSTVSVNVACIYMSLQVSLFFRDNGIVSTGDDSLVPLQLSATGTQTQNIKRCVEVPSG